MFTVLPPQVLTVNVSLTATLTSASAAATCVPSIENYVGAYLNSLPIGKVASITRVAQNAYRAGHGVENITEVQLNGGASDVIPPSLSVIKAGQIVVSTNDG
jgi:hypothetical protein